MSLVEFSLRRRVTVSMGAVALVLFGVVSFTRLPINLLPDLSYPSLTIETKFPGAAPGEIETLVSRPIEEAVGVVSGVQRLTSVSRPGLSQVTLEFGWGRNMDFASLDVRQKLDLVVLPREADRPVLLRFDPANDPILRLYITGGESLYQIRYVAEEVLKKDLESTEGVAAIKVNGGYEEEIQVRVDEGKLALMGLSIQDVNQRLLQENVNQAGGSLYESEARYLVRSRNEFRDLDDILRTVLVAREGRNVTMGDVAEVVRGHKQREVVTRFGGQEAVEMAIYKEGDANTVQVARAVQARLERVRGELPDGIGVMTGVDQSQFIRASIREVINNAVLGGLIAIGVLLFFLKDIASTLIIGVSIPISIIATFFLMYQTGTSLNIMSLGGLALGAGMLVDNAVVVLESIFKRREAGQTGLAAAQGGASEVSRAVIASTLTTVTVFLPVVFLEGMAAQLFKDQALTVSFSLLASLAVSLTLIPMLAALAAGGRPVEIPGPPAPEARWHRRWLRRLFVTLPARLLGFIRALTGWIWKGLGYLVRPLSRGFDAALAALLRAYPPVLVWALRSRSTVLGLSFLALVGTLLLVPRLGLDLVPTFSQGEFGFQVDLPDGTPLDVTDRHVAGVQSVLAGDARVESYASIVGGAGLSLTRTGTEGENSARIQVRMKPGTTSADEEAVAALLRERLEASDQADFKFERPSYFSFRTPIELEVYGENLGELFASSAHLQRRMEEVPGLVDVESSAGIRNPELQVTFNRSQLALLGVDVGEITRTIRDKVQGEVATRFQEGDREIDILVRSVEVGQATVDDLRNLIVGQRKGVPLFLKSVAEVRLAEGPSEIRRIGQKRAVLISGNLAGRDMGAVAADVRQAVRGEILPASVTAGLSGQEEEMRRSLRSLLMALALAIFLVYLVMASEFESLLHPFVVMFTLPLGAIGAVGALTLTGRTINVVAMIGGVMLAGIVVNNAIVLIDTVNQMRREGLPKQEALVQAGLKRLRPILMTSLTTILALLPMAIGLGEGAELRAPLAITVIGGLLAATALTLVVIPVVYSVLDPRPLEERVAATPAAAGTAPLRVGFGSEIPDPSEPLA